MCVCIYIYIYIYIRWEACEPADPALCLNQLLPLLLGETRHYYYYDYDY